MIKLFHNQEERRKFILVSLIVLAIIIGVTLELLTGSRF
jgi:hypothetical protein